MNEVQVRNAAPGIQPRVPAAWVVDYEDGDDRYYDFIVYDRRLSDAEVKDYELDFIEEVRK